jgi:hypothetical protein
LEGSDLGPCHGVTEKNFQSGYNTVESTKFGPDIVIISTICAVYGLCSRLFRLQSFLMERCSYIFLHPSEIVIKCTFCVSSYVLTAASMKVTSFWDIALYSFVEVDRRFRGVYCLHHLDPDDGGSNHKY